MVTVRGWKPRLPELGFRRISADFGRFRGKFLAGQAAVQWKKRCAVANRAYGKKSDTRVYSDGDGGARVSI